MENFVNTFGKWTRLSENEGAGYSSIEEKIEDLKRLAELGLIPISEIKASIRKKKAETIINIMPDIKELIDSPEYQELKSHGLELVSSKTQLLNGSILFGYPGYSRHNNFAIGIFPRSKFIRRITPKGIPMGIWKRQVGSQDIIVKRLEHVPDNKLYRVALRWILDHIDFISIDAMSRTPYFPVKKKTRRGYFDQD